MLTWISCEGEWMGKGENQTSGRGMDNYFLGGYIKLYTTEGCKKMVSTCPRQVVLASGQVDYQSYLSFRQVYL